LAITNVSKFKTWTARKEDLNGDWFVVDATGVSLGRLASNVAKVLKGKHKPTYTPHLNTGDHVIVVNASRVLVTGSKMDGKVYTRYSGPEHEHAAQSPKRITFNEKGDIQVV
jgi:large subunit ribosomal protein L13